MPIGGESQAVAHEHPRHLPPLRAERHAMPIYPRALRTEYEMTP
jgi:hypothetical protein